MGFVRNFGQNSDLYHVTSLYIVEFEYLGKGFAILFQNLMRSMITKLMGFGISLGKHGILRDIELFHERLSDYL